MRLVVILCSMAIASATMSAADTLSLSLKQAIDLALQRNFDVRLARQDSLLAANTGATAITGYLPRVNVAGNASTGRTDLRQTMADGRLIAKDQAAVHTLGGSVALQWTLFDGFKMFATADKARALEEQGIARMRATMQTVIADVITAYAAVVAAQQFQTIVDSAFVLAEQRFSIAQQQYDVGTTSGVDLAQARIDMNSQRVMAVQTRADLANATSALLTLLGLPTSTYVMADTALESVSVPSANDLTNRLDSLNPDLIVLQKSLEVASAHVRETNAAFMPQIGVSASYQYNRVNQDAGFVLQNQSAGWTLGAQLQWNIFNGFADNLAREQALLEVQRTRINVEAVGNVLRGQVDRMYRNYQTASAQLVLEQASFDDAQRNASVAVDGLRIGTVNALQVRQALLTLLEIGERVVKRRYEQRLAATELFRLTGMLVQ